MVQKILRPLKSGLQENSYKYPQKSDQHPTWVWHEHFVNEVDDSIGGDNVLFQHHLDAIHS